MSTFPMRFSTKRVGSDLHWCASRFKSLRFGFAKYNEKDAVRESILIEYRANDAGIFNKCGQMIRLCVSKGVAGPAAAAATQLANRDSNPVSTNGDTAITFSAY